MLQPSPVANSPGDASSWVPSAPNPTWDTAAVLPVPIPVLMEVSPPEEHPESKKQSSTAGPDLPPRVEKELLLKRRGGWSGE